MIDSGFVTVSLSVVSVKQPKATNLICATEESVHQLRYLSGLASGVAAATCVVGHWPRVRFPPADAVETLCRRAVECGDERSGRSRSSPITIDLEGVRANLQWRDRI